MEKGSSGILNKLLTHFTELQITKTLISVKEEWHQEKLTVKTKLMIDNRKKSIYAIKVRGYFN